MINSLTNSTTRANKTNITIVITVDVPNSLALISFNICRPTYVFPAKTHQSLLNTSDYNGSMGYKMDPFFIF